MDMIHICVPPYCPITNKLNQMNFQNNKEHVSWVTHYLVNIIFSTTNPGQRTILLLPTNKKKIAIIDIINTNQLDQFHDLSKATYNNSHSKSRVITLSSPFPTLKITKHRVNK